jgi:hypothetical protein
MKYKSSSVGETIAFSICNKPFKPLGLPRGRVKSREGLPGMIPTNILKYYVVDKQWLPYKNMVHTSWDGLTRWSSHSHHLTSKIIQLIHGKLRQLRFKCVQSETNIDSWGFNFFSKILCTPKFIGISSDENNQGLNQMCIFFSPFFLFFIFRLCNVWLP